MRTRSNGTPEAPSWTSEPVGEGFTPLGFSSSMEFSGRVVFVGYGIRAEPLGYDDYAGVDVDVDGKVVLAMRYEPGEPERISYRSGFDGFPMFSPDGRWLVFASNRAGGHQTNLYIARWIP